MFSTIRASIAAVIVTGSLVSAAAAAPGQVCYFNDCGPAPTTQATAAPTGGTDTSHRVATHGSWTALADGGMTMIIDRFDDGAAFGIAYEGNNADILMSAPKWQMHKGDMLDVKLDVDGDVFRGKATVLDETTIRVSNVGVDFTHEFYSARKVQVFTADDTFTITSIPDANATLEDAKLYRRTSAN